MARRKGKGESISGYFRPLFAEHPEWLHGTSNDAILAKYREDHGMALDAPVDKNIKQNLANLKSNLRKQGRQKRRGRPPKSNGLVSAAVITATPVIVHRPDALVLETLEERI